MKTRVIILAGGIGSRLKPFTESTPKSLFKLAKDETILERMVNVIKTTADAEIYVVTGFQHEKIESLLTDVTCIYNPFYRVSNSIVSLWFARDYLDDNVIIINSDVVFEQDLFTEVLKLSGSAVVLMDSSKKFDADYKVATYNDRVIMMSKELTACTGEYVGITKLLKDSAGKLRAKIEEMIKNDQIDEWYENALVSMVLDDDFVLNYHDISQFQWVEVDMVDDLVSARRIYEADKFKNE